MIIKTVKIGDIAEQVRGVTYSKSDASPDESDGMVPILRANNITDQGLQFSNLVWVPKSCVSSKQMLRKGDIVVATSSGSLDVVGKAAPVEHDVQASFGAFCKVVRPGESADSHYLANYFKTAKYRSIISSLAAGANINNLRNEHINSLEIPLPPLAEQKRIASILDKADGIRRKLQQSLRLSDDFLRSVFLDTFGDPVANPKGWPIVTIRDLLVATAYGTSKKASEAEGQFPCLRMNNITYNGGWNFTSLKYVDLDKNEQSKNLVHAGQLLFNRTNSKELVGKTAVYRRKEPMAFAGYLVRGIANDESDTEYISAFLNLPHGKAILQGMCKNIIGMANINAEEFKSIRIAKPPVTLQKRFAKIVISTEQKKETLQKFLTEAETLFSSLQQRAFRGEL